MTEIIYALLALAAIPAIRAAIKSYRAKKAIRDVIVDAVEAAVDEIDKDKK
jgi:acyl-coenzyme A synthetase/AMP-(fatty) acid ligase